MQRAARLKHELRMLASDPPHGVTCWLVEDSNCELEAQILGQEGTPYHRGVFKLLIHLPERYPFEAPKVRFSTPIYHPNIDNGGRICLDILKPPPSGSWRPSMNIASVLTSILLLMAEANPDDPLMVDISTEFKQNRTQFTRTACAWTVKFASGENVGASSMCHADSRSAAELPRAVSTPLSDTASRTRSDELADAMKTAAMPSGATRGGSLLKRRQPIAAAAPSAASAVACDTRQPASGKPDAISLTKDRPSAEALRSESHPLPHSTAGHLAMSLKPSVPPVSSHAAASWPSNADYRHTGEQRDMASPATTTQHNPATLVSRAQQADAVDCVVIDDSDDTDYVSDNEPATYMSDVMAYTRRGIRPAGAMKRFASDGDDDDDECSAKRVCYPPDTDYRSDEDIL
ncbi:uncharacterized protein LOC135828335 [Sycon ciliatum]|uniref:uncharacterized protein LOC135828335 n=1 Tax=Sycon ciliatum TaxID=27933 RepID=UPI0031F6E4B0